jgi:hypothetical protein
LDEGIPLDNQGDTPMPHLSALRNSVLCGFAVVAVAGCGAAHLTVAAPPATAPVSVTTAPTPTPVATPDTSGISQQVSSIDNQLSTIDGQLNAANAGLSTSEGNPAQ